MATRVLIVDDHPVIREGLARRIGSEPDLEVCGEAADVAEALQQFAETQPDVMIVDIQLKGGDGLDLVKRIKARNDAIAVLVCSAYPDRVYAERVLQAGALGYVNKMHSSAHIIEAIRRVRDGKVYLCEEAAEHILRRAVGRSGRTPGSSIDSLSDRELEVFRHVGNGLTTSEMARQMHISTHTVETHKQRIKEKLHLATANELTQAAIRWVLDAQR